MRLAPLPFALFAATAAAFDAPLQPGALVAVAEGTRAQVVHANVEVRPYVGEVGWQGVVLADAGDDVIVQPRHMDWCLPTLRVSAVAEIALRVPRSALLPVLTRPIHAATADGGSWALIQGQPAFVDGDHLNFVAGDAVLNVDAAGHVGLATDDRAGPEYTTARFGGRTPSLTHTRCVAWSPPPSPPPPVLDRIGGVIGAVFVAPTRHDGSPLVWGDARRLWWPDSAPFAWDDGAIGRRAADADVVQDGARWCAPARVNAEAAGRICTEIPPNRGGVKIIVPPTDRTPGPTLTAAAASLALCLRESAVRTLFSAERAGGHWRVRGDADVDPACVDAALSALPRELRPAIPAWEFITSGT